MQRIMKAQALGSKDIGMSMMMNKKTMELNPYNITIKRIKEKLDSDNDESRTLNDLVHLLYEVTLQSSGFTLDDPSTFSNRIIKLINFGLGAYDDEEESQEENDSQPILEESIEESTMEQVD
jgi:molecular chaperone HtpG